MPSITTPTDRTCRSPATHRLGDPSSRPRTGQLSRYHASEDSIIDTREQRERVDPIFASTGEFQPPCSRLRTPPPRGRCPCSRRGAVEYGVQERLDRTYERCEICPVQFVLLDHACIRRRPLGGWRGKRERKRMGLAGTEGLF